MLIVKGLPGKKESRFFDYIGHATYRDEGGNFIVVKNREQLVYLHKKVTKNSFYKSLRESHLSMTKKS
ncbi:MAG: hypothetical protein IPN29_06030 [Saprospiraceae bacterium]|nr:hypothetical protein [Saprospiraceae bacterium]